MFHCVLLFYKRSFWTDSQFDSFHGQTINSILSLCRWKATRQPRASALPRGSWECFLACLRSWMCFLQKGFLCMMRREVAWLASAPLPLKLHRSPLPLLSKLLGTGTACYSLRTQTVQREPLYKFRNHF